ncbi:hypothetical protein C6A37_00535 [Desulfobacteraceae bacterium SEEP-SAG9]|nr:hypothetical protein C6A37_00535 [Desulfobacteraceae bacterium SEEP-SAG9]
MGFKQLSSNLTFKRAKSKTSHFAQSLRQAQILILEILNVFLWLKFSPSLTLNKLKRFENGSFKKIFLWRRNMFR